MKKITNVAVLPVCHSQGVILGAFINPAISSFESWISSVNEWLSRHIKGFLCLFSLHEMVQDDSRRRRVICHSLDYIAKPYLIPDASSKNVTVSLGYAGADDRLHTLTSEQATLGHLFKVI